MFEIWRVQKWNDKSIVHYNVRMYGSYYVTNINDLNEAKKNIKIYADYLKKLQSESEYFIYANKDYLYILDVEKNFKIYYDLNKDKYNQAYY